MIDDLSQRSLKSWRGGIQIGIGVQLKAGGDELPVAGTMAAAVDLLPRPLGGGEADEGDSAWI